MNIPMIILAGSGVVITLAVVILAVRLFQTIGELDRFLRETRRETTPLLKNADRVLERVQRITETVENRVNDAEHNVDAVLQNLTSITEQLRDLSQDWNSKLQPNGRWTGWMSTVLASGYQAFQKYRSKKKEDPQRKGGYQDE